MNQGWKCLLDKKHSSHVCWSYINETYTLSSCLILRYLPVCLCIYRLVWNNKHKVSQSSELWMGYLHGLVPSGTVFYFCWGETEHWAKQRQRGSLGENDSRMMRNWGAVTQIEPKRECDGEKMVWLTSSLRMDEASVVYLCTLFSHAPCSPTEVKSLLQVCDNKHGASYICRFLSLTIIWTRGYVQSSSLLCWGFILTRMDELIWFELIL